MDVANVVLPIILYILGSILLIVLIILGIKMIVTMNKIEGVVDEVDRKVRTLDNFFSIIDVTTDKLSLLSDKMVDVISFVIGKFFKNKKRKDDIDE